MGLPPSAVRHFAIKRIEAAEKHLAAVQETLFKEGHEDRRALEKFHNNLALFSGGTIALSITYLGYVKSLGKAVVHQRLLTASWASLFLALLFSLAYVLVNVYYGYHFRQRELAEANKSRYETEAEELPKMGLANIQTAEQIAAIHNPRNRAAQKYAEKAAHHKKKEERYHKLWLWAGRIAQLAFVAGIGLLLWFAILNT